MLSNYSGHEKNVNLIFTQENHTLQLKICYIK